LNPSPNTQLPLFATPAVDVQRRADGALIVRNPMPLQPYARCVGEWLEYWGRQAPERDFLLQRGADGGWHGVTYGQALARVRRIAAWLLAHERETGNGAKMENGVNSSRRPVCVLSGNSVNHGLLMLACLHVGIPYAAVSPAYCLMSRDYAKVKNLIERLEPMIIFAEGAARFAPAMTALQGLHQALWVVGDEDRFDELPAAMQTQTLHFGALLERPQNGEDDAAVNAAFASLTPDTLAKILFTSGSTGTPKGVLNTQRMLCASQQSKQQIWPFLQAQPPVLLDWLPWNHTFGGNHNLNMMLCNGGTLYIDGGKPVSGAFDTTLNNLREVAPTLYMNVPHGFDMLVPALREDAALRKQFFSRLQVIFYAAAALPQHLWDALIDLSREELGQPVSMVTAWGSTETSPLATDCYFQAERSGVIGLPVPGMTLKLIPNGDKLEIRLKGDMVTPGYFKQPNVTAQSFDEEGWYLIGDAVRFVDPDNPVAGLVFDGRVSEDFKLMTATWVSVGTLRIKGVEALAPLAQDIVVTGHDRDSVGFLVFPNLAACRQLAGADEAVPVPDVLAHPAVRAKLRQGLQTLHEQSGGASSLYADRALLLLEPPSVDDGEITDKGYINQSAVLRLREDCVQALYGDIHGTPPDPRVVWLREG